jgi:uncharacterized coiled-coil protein SlyX
MSDKIVAFPSRASGQGGGGPGDSGMERRIERLEESLGRVAATLDRIESSVRRTETDVAELKGRMTGLDKAFGTMPTSLQLLGFAVAVFVAAGVFRFFEPRLFPAAAHPPAMTGTR